MATLSKVNKECFKVFQLKQMHGVFRPWGVATQVLVGFKAKHQAVIRKRAFKHTPIFESQFLDKPYFLRHVNINGNVGEHGGQTYINDKKAAFY